jgi:hypothetical protein
MSKPEKTFRDHFSSFAESVLETAAKFAVNYIGMATTAVPAQPLISAFSKMSANSGVSGTKYFDTLRAISSMPRKDMEDILRSGFVRRVGSAIPVAAGVMATGDSLNFHPLIRSIAAATIETYCARHSDPKEMFNLMNKGVPLSPQDLKQRQEIAADNRGAALSVLFTRNLLYSLAIYSIDSTTNLVMKNFGDPLKKITGLDEDKLKSSVNVVVRATYCASTTPFNNIYGHLVSGAEKALPVEVFEPRVLFRGAGARTAALFTATTSIAKGKEIAASAQTNLAKLAPDFMDFFKHLKNLVTNGVNSDLRVSGEFAESAVMLKKQVQDGFSQTSRNFDFSADISDWGAGISSKTFYLSPSASPASVSVQALKQQDSVQTQAA